MEKPPASPEMDSKLQASLPTITEDSSHTYINSSETPSSETSSSLNSSLDSSDVECDDGKLTFAVKNISLEGPKTAPASLFNSNMFCFTRSISALNTMAFSMGVLRAKNAFMRKLSQDQIPTPADYKAAGDKQWENIAAVHKATLKFDNMDFTDLKVDEPDALVNTASSLLSNGVPPPPPPPPGGGLRNTPPPPPPLRMNGQMTAAPPPPPPPPKILPNNVPFPPPPPPSLSGGPPPPPPPPNLRVPVEEPHFEEKCVLVQRSECTSRPKPPTKLVKLHWRPIPAHCLSNTMWKQLPTVEVDKQKFEALFKIEEKVRRHSLETISKPKELLVLDTNRSNQINIGIKNLPPISRLKILIEEMDDKIITREGVEKLQSLMPSEEEITSIKEAQNDNPEDLPLGTAEQFLLLLNSISDIECRLKLWAFKVDFKAMEKDICEPLKSLKDSMKSVRTSKSFARMLSLILEVGNVLNKSQTKGFQLDYLPKISWVKDTATKKPLLYHIVKELLSDDPLAADLAKDFADLIPVSRNDYEQLQTNLQGMEDECKNSLGYMKLSARYNSRTSELVSMFLTNAAERIMSMRSVLKLVMAEYNRFLSWLGIQAHLHKDYPPKRTTSLLVDFAKEVTDMRKTVLNEIMKENKRKERMMKGFDRSKSTSGKTSSRLHKLRRSVKSVDGQHTSPNPSADGLEAFLDAAAIDLKKTKRRRSKKVNLEDIDITTM